MRLAAADRYAETAVGLLRPACESVVVVGSVRRRRDPVKDLAVAVRPAGGNPQLVFGDPASVLTPLDRLLRDLVRLGVGIVVRDDVRTKYEYEGSGSGKRAAWYLQQPAAPTAEAVADD